jgi:class 3 adenylate cyclase/DNA-binding winged helix-turn-helix (wHTH) protein/tetratricopeptide (TPR) repeat protein
MRYLFGHYCLDTQRCELSGAGTPIKLRRQAFQMLVYLLRHRDRVVPRQELLAHLWPEQFVGDEALKSCLKTLRKALGERGRAPHFVRTLYGQGYRFVAAVEVQEHLPVDDVALVSLPTAGMPHPPAAHGGEGWGEEGIRTAWNDSHAPLKPLPAREGALSEASAPLATTLDGEHKQVTVLCGALAEAPTLVACQGPEVVYHLMRDVLALAHNTVQRYDGTLLQVSGEGFVALFGAPMAQEDHARRAVLAAFELRQRLHGSEASRGQPHGLALSLGLHTGPVVVGSLRHDPQRPYTAVGDTLALAMRLQHQAAPDTLLLSAATYALVQDEVQGEAWAAGTSDAAVIPVTGYVVHGILRRRAGVPRRSARPLSRFVGRARELALLHERLALAASRQGQAVGLVGEPGMGKSRLLAEFAHSLDGQAVTYCEGHCLAYGSVTPYLPVCDLLRQLWDLPDTAARDAITATIQQQLHAAGIVADHGVPLLLQCLDVPGEVAALADLSPQERRAQTFALLRQIVLRASQRRPLVLAVENLHWSDPTSEEWLTALAAQLGGTAILLLATYRPGYRLPWLAHSWATQVALPPLNTPDSLVVVQAVPQAAQIPAHQRQAIVTRAAGNPFFLEELTWAAVESGDSTHTQPLPDTVQAVLAARLDHLPQEAQRLVQMAAVIGPEVPMPLLERVVGLTADGLQRSLAHLQSTELLYERQLFPDPVYTFKHALTHDVAYHSLLLEQRRVLHARIVEALEALAPDRLAEQVERLAHHALRGEVWDKAFAYCRQAGTKAYAGSAYREAVGYWEQALEALAHLPPDRPTLEQAADVHGNLYFALLSLTQYPQMLTHLRAAEALAAGLADRRRLGIIYRSLANTLRLMQDYESALAYSQRAHAMATALGDVGLQLESRLAMGWTYCDLGDHGQAMEHLQQALTTLQGAPRAQAVGLGHGLGLGRDHRLGNRLLITRTWMASCLSQLGAFAAGVACRTEALQLAEAVDRPYECLNVYQRVGYLHVRQGNLHQAIPMIERGVALSQEVDMPIFYHPTATSLALAYALAGRAPDALSLLQQIEGFPVFRREAYLRAGEVEEADRLVQRGLANARECNRRGEEAWALWLLGEIAMHRDPPDLALADVHYRQALTLADALGLRPLQAHCHRGLGTLYAETGQRESARAALAAAIALYRAMEMTFWLPQAEAMLAQVA